MGPLSHFTLDPEVMKTWGVGMWAFFILIFSLIGGILLSLFLHYSTLGIMGYYVAWAMLLTSFMIWNTKRQAKFGKHLHIHHYTLAMIVMSFISY